MRIKNYKKFSKEELIKKLRKVTLLNSSRDNPIFIYEKADIELATVPVSSLMPAQLYQLEEVLEKVKELQGALQEHNLDLFNLKGYLSYETDDSENLRNLLPVIVEYQLEEDKKVHPLILDGIHRVILARIQNLDKIQVVKIANVNKDFPVFAYANPKEWEDVRLMNIAPEPKDKRHWRFPIKKAYRYYRNFNSAFENVGKPRE